MVPYDESTLGGWSSVGRPSVFVPWDEFDETDVGFTGLLLAGIVDPNCEALGGARTSVLTENGGFCRFQYTAFDITRPDRATMTIWGLHPASGSGSLPSAAG